LDAIAAQKQQVKRRARRAAGKQRAKIVATKKAQAAEAARRGQQSTPSVSGNTSNATPDRAGNPLVNRAPRTQSPRPDTKGSGSTERAQPLLDNSFDN
jgi:general stress protein YciG